MLRLLRVMLGLLGLFIGWSAVQHWIGSADLNQHYEATHLGESGRYVIALAQSTAAIFLLWPRFQASAGLILGTVLFAISLRQVGTAGVQPAFWEPFLVAVFAIASSVLLLQVKRVNAR